MANKNAIIIGVVVVIVAVAAIAAFALNNNNDDKDKTPELGVGDSMTFEVFGTYGDDGTLIDGTITMKLLDETDTQYKYETEQSIYTVATDGKKTALYVGKNTDWTDKDDEDMVSKGTLTVDTFWGEKKLSHYESKDGTEHNLVDGDIIYAGMLKNDNMTMYMELTDCTAIKDKKVDRDVHEIGIVTKGDLEQDGNTYVVTYTYGVDNKKSEIFKKLTYSMDMALKSQPDNSVEIMSYTAWSDPFDDDTGGMVNIGTEKISTEWGTKMTDVYKKVENGITYTQYNYKEVPVRLVIEEDGAKITLDATSITVDGKSVTLEEAAEL